MHMVTIITGITDRRRFLVDIGRILCSKIQKPTEAERLTRIPRLPPYRYRPSKEAKRTCVQYYYISGAICNRQVVAERLIEFFHFDRRPRKSTPAIIHADTHKL